MSTLPNRETNTSSNERLSLPIREPKFVGVVAALRDAILEVDPEIATFEHIRHRVWPDVPNPRHLTRLSGTASALREKLALCIPPKNLVNIRGRGYKITD